MVEKGRPLAFPIYLDKSTPPTTGEMPSTRRTESHVSMVKQRIFLKCLEITCKSVQYPNIFETVQKELLIP